MIDRVASLMKMEVPEADGLLFASGSTVPTSGTYGYATGCLFQHTDGGAGTAVYVNEGTLASCSFAAVAALTADQEALLSAVAGTATASKAVILDANKAVDVVRTASLMIGTSGAEVAVAATALEINSAADQSANTEDISGAGALSISKRVSQVAGGTGFAVTLAAPTAAEVGKLKIVTLESITSSAVTMALTNVIGGTAGSSASFDAAGETLVMVGVESAPASFKWLVLKEHGVTLS